MVTKTGYEGTECEWKVAKETKMIIRTLLVILISCTNVLFAGQKGGVMNSQISSYKMGLIPSNYSTDPNVSLDVVIAVSGNGVAKRAKILIYSDDEVGIILEEKEYKKAGFIRIDTRRYFVEEENKFKSQLPDTFPIKSEFTEMIKKIKLRSDKGGDHIVFFILSYTPDDMNWYSDRLEFKFHVNTFLDRNLWWLTVLGIVIAGLAALATIASSIKTLFLTP
jgi:hypothetical protein